jgi:membrane protease YdiL (CAAX protease family)
MELIFGGLLMVGIILAANLLVLRDNKTEKTIFIWLLFLANVPLLLAGLGLSASSPEVLQELLQGPQPAPINAEGLKAMGLPIILMAVWGMIMSLVPVQALLARLIPIKPGSPVHSLALVLAGYLIGYTGLALSQGGVEALAETAEPTSLGLFVFSEMLFAAIGLLGAGWLIRRNGREILKRLGLVRPTIGQLMRGVGWIIILVILQSVAGAVWFQLNPEQVSNLDELNSALLGDFDTIWEWLILALAAGIGEEILFRGAIQPVFGLLFTSILFAIVHIQYGFSLATIIVIILALILGIIRRRTNTTVAIFVHAGYNFVIGIIALLSPYLEQLAP